MSLRPRPPRVVSSAAAVVDLYPCTCIYCDRRFEKPSSRNWHMASKHMDEIASWRSRQCPKWRSRWRSKQRSKNRSEQRSEQRSKDRSEQPERKTGRRAASKCRIDYDTLLKVLALCRAKNGRPESPPQESASTRGWGSDGETAVSGQDAPTPLPNEETIKQKALAALREMDVRPQKRRSCCLALQTVSRELLLPASTCGTEGAAELEMGATFGVPPVETDSLASPKRETKYISFKEETPVETDQTDILTPPTREIETIFVDEETVSLHEWESPDGPDTVQDPLSIEEEEVLTKLLHEWVSPDGPNTAQDPLSIEEEEEGDALAENPLSICESQSIKKEVTDNHSSLAHKLGPLPFKKEVLQDPLAVSLFSDRIKDDPELDFKVEAADNKEAATRRHASDITRNSLSVSKVTRTRQDAPGSLHVDDDCCEDNTPASDTKVSVGAATLTTSPSGTYNSGSVGVNTNGLITTKGVGEKKHAGNVGKACTANTRPPFCYAELIAMAIAHSPHRRAKRSEIFAYIASRFPYYEPSKKSWQNVVSDNLSRNRCFVKVPPEGSDHEGRPGNYWTLDPQYEEIFKKGNFRRLRRTKLPSRNSPSAAVTPAKPGDAAHAAPRARSPMEGDCNNDDIGVRSTRDDPEAPKGDSILCTSEWEAFRGNDSGTTQLLFGREDLQEGSRRASRGHSCSVCHKQFTRRGNLQQHAHLHTRERPYSCGVCQKMFKRNSHLKRHSLLHTTGEQHCSCGFCQKALTAGSELRKHLLARKHCARCSPRGLETDATEVHA